VAKKRWADLSARSRRLIIAGGVWEVLLKAAALIDLAMRPASGVRGSKTRWAFAVTLVNSVGVVPIAYLVYGRRGSRLPR
jgi:hypothetical protein